MHKGRKPAASSRRGFASQHLTSENVARTPTFRILLGLIMLLMMAIVACFSVLTTQNWIKGGDGSNVVLSWGVFLQVLISCKESTWAKR